MGISAILPLSHPSESGRSPAKKGKNFMGAIKNIDQSQFASEVLQQPGAVLVDFWAPWCAPCRALSPTLEQIAAETPKAKVVKINIDENQDVAVQFGVTNIPYLAVFKGGKLVDSMMGNQSRARIAQMLASHL